MQVESIVLELTQEPTAWTLEEVNRAANLARNAMYRRLIPKVCESEGHQFGVFRADLQGCVCERCWLFQDGD